MSNFRAFTLRVGVVVGLAIMAVQVSASEKNIATQQERRSQLRALDAAYQAMDRSKLSSKGKTIVIKAEGVHIFISFLNSKPGTYGGQAHITYDVNSNKVVKIESED